MHNGEIHDFSSRRALASSNSSESETTIYHGGQANHCEHMAFDGGEGEEDALVEAAQGQASAHSDSLASQPRIDDNLGLGSGDESVRQQRRELIRAPHTNGSRLPQWMQADEISFSEKIELRFYKCVTLIPTSITLSLLVVLSTYYIFVSKHLLTLMQFYLRPVCQGDFYGTIGITEFWESQDALEASMATGYWQAAVFAYFFLSTLVCLALAMTTPPGSIPDALEWDMPPQESSKEKIGERPSVNTAAFNLEGLGADQQPR